MPDDPAAREDIPVSHSLWAGRVASWLAAAAGIAAAVAPAPLRFADFPLFADRAHRLALGDTSALADSLYPVGYPIVLAAAHAVVGDGLLAGRLIAALAAAVLLVGVGWRSPLAAAAIAGTSAFAAWGPVEGTDVVAASLGALALWVARSRPGLAGACAGAALLCRFPAVAVIPWLLWCAGPGWRTAARGPIIAVALHFGAATLAGGGWLPDQRHNLEIGGSLSSLPLRWPVATLHAAGLTITDPVVAAALFAAVAGWRRDGDRRGRALIGYAATHCGLLGIAFANPRLVLPAAVAVAAAGGRSLDRWLPAERWRYGSPILALAAVGLLVARLAASGPTERESARDVLLARVAPVPVATTSPDVWVRVDGWPLPCRSIRDAGSDDPAAVLAWLDAAGFTQVVLEDDRVRHQWRGLRPWLREPPPGWAVVAAGGGWRLLAKKPASSR